MSLLEHEKHLESVSVASYDAERAERAGWVARVTRSLARWGVETQGVDPIPPVERTDTRLYQMFFVWFAANVNVTSFGTGSVGPAFFGLGTKEALITILIVDVVCCAVPAYFAVFGPKLGTRAMVQARFSWGYYGAMLPSALNVFSMQGFLILNSIIGGQALASVSDHLSATLGIVIIAVITLIVTFCGYRVIHWYESVAWIPSVIIFIVILGVGGKHLVNAPAQASVDASAIMTFATTTAASVISWCTMTADYGVYHNSKVSSLRVFIYTYLGFLGASIPGHMLGVVFAASAYTVPAWNAGFDNGNSVGGLLAAILEPVGGFGKFMMVIVALTIPSACAPTMYTFGTSFMTMGAFFNKVPRYVFALVSEAILIPVAIIGATHFYATFVDILSVIGYWSTVFAVIVLSEHVWFRRNDFSLYNVEDWDTPRRLPTGGAAILTFLCAIGMVVPCMSQAWYVGPIAKMGSGDIGIMVGSGVALLVYPVLRAVERRLFGF